MNFRIWGFLVFGSLFTLACSKGSSGGGPVTAGPVGPVGPQGQLVTQHNPAECPVGIEGRYRGRDTGGGVHRLDVVRLPSGELQLTMKARNYPLMVSIVNGQSQNILGMNWIDSCQNGKIVSSITNRDGSWTKRVFAKTRWGIRGRATSSTDIQVTDMVFRRTL